MGMFSRLFWLFEKGRAHKDLEEAYSHLNELANLLSKELNLLREMQKEIITRRLKRVKYNPTATGAIGLSKTEFIEEELIQKIKKVAKITEDKFEKAVMTRTKTVPANPLEKREIEQITEFLNKLFDYIPSLEKIQKLNEADKLQLVETSLRQIVALSKEFHDRESHKKEMVQQLDEEAISPLLREIYNIPEHHPKESSLLLYRLTPTQLREVEEESKRINACNDPNYSIEWRKWWREVQVPEKNKTTPLKDSHINVTIKLFGGPKKDIHLLLAA